MMSTYEGLYDFKLTEQDEERAVHLHEQNIILICYFKVPYLQMQFQSLCLKK